MLKNQNNVLENKKNKIEINNETSYSTQKVNILGNLENLNDDSINRLRNYITFYRRNLNIFVTDYFGLHLHPFQEDILYQMGNCDNSMIVASRAVSKTWTLGVASCAICCLYPKSEVVIVAGKIDQAGLVVKEKILKELIPNCPNLAKEINKIDDKAYMVDFYNGSSIKVVPALETARGERATMIIFEEFRLIPKHIVDTVVQPMSHPRVTPFNMLPKYKGKVEPEETRMCFISSSGYAHEWIASAIKSQMTEIVNGKNRCFFAFDYHLAILHGLKTIIDIESARTANDEVSFLIEYCNILYGENLNGFYTLEQMRKCQKIQIPFYPIKPYERMMETECSSCTEFVENEYGSEIRVIGFDIATAGGANNDATCLQCIRGIPTANGYLRKFVYNITYNGMNAVEQCLMVRRLFKDFKADFMVMDLANQGRTMYSMLTQDYTDEETGEFYLGWTIIDDDSLHLCSRDVLDDLRTSTISSNALPIIFPIKANDDQNHLFATDFRKQLNNNMVELLIEELEADIMLNKDRDYRELMSSDNKSWLFEPYRNNSDFITETIQLNAEYKGGKVKLKEPSGERKDRYSSGSYANYFISLKEIKLLKKDDADLTPQEYAKAIKNMQRDNKMKNRSRYFR